MSSSSLFAICCDSRTEMQMVDITAGPIEEQRLTEEEEEDAMFAARFPIVEQAPMSAQLSKVMCPGEPDDARQRKVSLLVSDMSRTSSGGREALVDVSPSVELRRARVATMRPSSSSAEKVPSTKVRASFAVLSGLGLDLSTRRRSSVQTTCEGKIHENYEFSDLLGKGGFGSVHAATRNKDGLSVAIKCIKAALTNPDVFEEELDQARRLRHPNIVWLLEAYRDAKMFYLVMELCTGGDLLALVAQHGLRRKDQFSIDVGLEPQLLRQYAWQMLSGTAYLHFHHIVHRDIKCENYMRKTPDLRAPLKLIDMGLSAIISPGQKLTEVVGTLTTIAPEVFMRSYTEKCDIWSLGVTLYICAVSMEPWVAENGMTYLDEKSIRRCLEDDSWEIPYDMRRWEVKPKECLNLVQEMLQRRPERRPRAQEILAHNAWLADMHRGGSCCGRFCS
mmetsp:Transcript_16429/g.38994  ORF Transcript_16429/g.38994 Transcript_16429/m.38994 type:complete len:448 (-) Transcript_16429:96-1439(-)